MVNQVVEIRHEQVFSVQKLSVLRKKSFSLSVERNGAKSSTAPWSALVFV